MKTALLHEEGGVPTMMLVDYIVWALILVGGLVLSAWYGLSWRAVARALADPKPSPADEPRSGAVADMRQDVKAHERAAGVLVEART